MSTERVRTIKSTITSWEHPYLSGAWTPNYEEYNATNLEVIGEIPADLDGVYLRNTENQIHESIGRYHPFDGDSMVHSMCFSDGTATYRNRFTQTAGFLAEQKAGKSLWAGLMEHPSKSLRPGICAQEGLKDSSSTDIIVHAGRALSTFYQCGEGYRLDPYTLEQMGAESWVPTDGISAHPKVDLRTGELLFFNYSKNAPYMHYGVVGADNKLKHYVPISVPGPRLPHDMAFTENYSILNDLPVFWDANQLKNGNHIVRFHENTPTRFGVIPRFGQPGDVKWFEAAPTYVLHWLNAWEEGDEIVLLGYFQDKPVPASRLDAPRGFERMMAYLDQWAIQPRLHKWRFNLRTGVTVEERLDDRTLEFGIINAGYGGIKNRFGYSANPMPGWFLFTGITKHDFLTGQSSSVDMGEYRTCSEAAFAPRTTSSGEDDGYLITFVTDMARDQSECVVIDAQDIESGPVCRIILPHRICAGTHATWANGEDIRTA